MFFVLSDLSSDGLKQAKMDDPSAVKPDDWDEDAPRQIVDEVRYRKYSKIVSW